MTKGSDLLVAALENEGVDRIFGVPGEENLDVVESLRTSSIELVLTRHEQSAAFMAATHGRLTGRPGVCISTLGPGALNLVDRCGLRATRRHADGDDHRPEGDHDGAAGPLPDRRHRRHDEAVDEVLAPDRERGQHPDAGAGCVSRRDGGAPRSVLLELPEDIAGEELSVDVPLVPTHPIDLPAAHPEAIERAATMIREAKRPLVMIGAAGSRPRLDPGLTEFIHRIGIPFFNTQMGKGVVAGGTNLWMGTAALSERDYVHEAIDKADLIVAIGHDTVEKPPFIMGPTGPKVIHIGYTPANVEQVYFPHAEVIGDVAARSRCWPTGWKASCRTLRPCSPLRERILRPGA